MASDMALYGQTWKKIKHFTEGETRTTCRIGAKQVSPQPQIINPRPVTFAMFVYDDMYGMVWYGDMYGVVWYDDMYGVVWYGDMYGVVWYGDMYGMVWYGEIYAPLPLLPFNSLFKIYHAK